MAQELQPFINGKIKLGDRNAFAEYCKKWETEKATVIILTHSQMSGSSETKTFELIQVKFFRIN